VVLDPRTRPLYYMCRPHLPRPRLRFSYSVGSSTRSALPLYCTTVLHHTFRVDLPDGFFQ